MCDQGGLVCLWEPGVRRLRRAHDRVTHTGRRFSRVGTYAELLMINGLRVERTTGANSFLVPMAAAKMMLEHGEISSDLDRNSERARRSATGDRGGRAAPPQARRRAGWAVCDRHRQASVGPGKTYEPQGVGPSFMRHSMQLRRLGETHRLRAVEHGMRPLDGPAELHVDPGQDSPPAAPETLQRQAATIPLPSMPSPSKSPTNGQ